MSTRLASTTNKIYLISKIWSPVLFSVSSGLMMERIIIKLQKTLISANETPNMKL